MSNSKLTTYDIPSVDELPKIDPPLFNKVEILPLETIKETAGGIILPTSVQDAASYTRHMGIIVVCGPTAFKNSQGKDMMENPPKRGDIVMYGKFGGMGYHCEKETKPDAHGMTRIELDKIIMVPDKDVLKIIKDPTGIRTDL